jgi:F-type H+-transporting ATPase subunit delta
MKYLSALFDICREQGVVEDVRDNLIALSGLMSESRELKDTLLDPRIGRSAKKKLLLRILEGSVSIVRDFVCLLVDKGRENVLEYAGEEFAGLLRESRNLLVAKVESACELDEQTKQDLMARLGALTGKDVELVEERADDLLGGVRIIFGSKMIDGSLKNRLKNMSRALKGGVA